MGFDQMVEMAELEECDNDRCCSGSSESNLQRKMRVVRVFQMWNLQFSGEETEDPAEFILRLEECMRGMELSESDVLDVLPCILFRSSSRWYRLCRPDFKCWNDFRLAFRFRFLGNLRDEDLMEDLKLRTQDVDETISEFLESFRLIVECFLKPASERVQMTQALRNLHPDYRHHMEGKVVDSFKTLEELGRKFERRKELDQRYKPAPSQKYMRLPGAAPKSRLKGVCSDSSSSKSTDFDEGSEFMNECVVNPIKERECDEGMNPELRQPEILECAALEFAGISNPELCLDLDASTEQNCSGNVMSVDSVVREIAGSKVVRPFSCGPCFVCNLMGHRAAQCPQRICWACLGMGHYAVECPERVAVQTELSCQVCGNLGSSFWSCINCESTRSQLDHFYIHGVWKPPDSNSTCGWSR